MAKERGAWVKQAQICLQANRSDDTTDAMKQVVLLSKTAVSLSVDERTLLSVAYKNSVGARRTSWRSLYLAEKRQHSINPSRYRVARTYRKRVEKELKDKCTELLNMIDNRLIPGVTDPESDVFYHKMKADYYRYLAEVEVDNGALAIDCIEKANENYKGALNHATINLSATHPLRLGLALNYSVFLHEQKQEPNEAKKIARNSYEAARVELDQVDDLDEHRYKKCGNMLHLLQENLRVWK